MKKLPIALLCGVLASLGMARAEDAAAVEAPVVVKEEVTEVSDVTRDLIAVGRPTTGGENVGVPTVIDGGEVKVVTADDTDVKVDVVMDDGPIFTFGGGTPGSEEVDIRIFQTSGGPALSEVARTESAPEPVAQPTAPAQVEDTKPEALVLDDADLKAMDVAKSQAKAQGFSVSKNVTKAAGASKAQKLGKRIFLK